MSQADLIEAFNFDEADVAANRDGQLSASQLRHLKKARTAATLTLLVLALPALGMSLLTALGGGALTGVPLVLYLIFVGGLAGLPTVRALSKLLDLRQVGVESVAGDFEYDLNLNPNRRYFPFTVGGRQFKVKMRLGRALKQHRRYRVYYLRDLGGLLSIEVLDD